MKIDYKEFKEFDNHRLIKKFEDRENKLRGYVAIHNNNLGAAVGGTRMFSYVSEREAIRDVLRLSKAMSYKCALAGVRYGGGKAVIIGDPQKIKSKGLLLSYANEIGKLKGKFSTGEDVGISEEDTQVMLTASPYFIGKKGFAGDPSPYAALSTYYSIQAASKYLFGNKKLVGKSIAVKGIGKVGSELVRLLLKENVNIFVSDIDRKAIKSIKNLYPNVTVVSSKKIHTLKVDIFAPCAMGNEFNNLTKGHIRAKIICGAANNQLSSAEIGDWFFDNNILYIPDYIANSGGLINVVDELEPGGYNKKRVNKRIRNVKNTVEKIIILSEKKKKSTVRISDELAEKKIKRKINRNEKK